MKSKCNPESIQTQFTFNSQYLLGPAKHHSDQVNIQFSTGKSFPTWSSLQKYHISTEKGVFGWICISSYPNVFLRRWGGCLVIPQRRWGPLGPHTTTVYTRRSSLVSHFYLYTIIVRQTSVEGLCSWGYPIHWQFMTWGPNNMGANAALHIWHIAFRCIEMKKLLML